MLNENIDRLVNANIDRRLAIFVGAGVSKSSEIPSQKSPTWADIINAIKSELNLSPSESDFLKIAQLYYLEVGEYNYFKKIKDYFEIELSPSLVHKCILEINPQIIITTNWDELLEQGTRKWTNIYDVIACDEDLVKSTLQSKIIKMHGDFKHHNIVFKEDDYILYANNFPLIENYLKSIMSTHVILFLGYSYNDPDMKQIMKWQQNVSKAAPPRYIVTFEDNASQAKYLQNHGITVIHLSPNSTDKSKPIDFNGLIIEFLDKIQNPKMNINTLNYDNIVSYFYDKLTPLMGINGIFIRQIHECLKFCTFIYGKNNLIILDMCEKLMMVGYDENDRLFNVKFVEIISAWDKGEYRNQNLDAIFEIFSRAEISGVKIEENGSSIKYVNIKKSELLSESDNAIYGIMNFSNSSIIASPTTIEGKITKAYALFQEGRTEDSFGQYEEIITECISTKNYPSLFLSMVNRNIVLHRLKYSLNHNLSLKYKDSIEYNIEQKLSNLPIPLQNKIKPIYKFVNSDFMKEFAYDLSLELKKKQDAHSTVVSGGMVFHSDSDKARIMHKNWLGFVLRNHMIIDQMSEFRKLAELFARTIVVQSFQNKEIQFSKEELYSAIKYLDQKTLNNIFIEFSGENPRQFPIHPTTIRWAIDEVLPNITSRIIDSHKYPEKDFEDYANLCHILALIKLDDVSILKVIKAYQDIIALKNGDTGIYKSFDEFLGIQHLVHKATITTESLIPVIDAIIDKFAFGRINTYDFMATTHGMTGNVYALIGSTKTLYSNDSAIDRLLMALNAFQDRQKIEISRSLLVNIYGISSNSIKVKIRGYIKSINIDLIDDIGERSITYLTFCIFGLMTLNARKISKQIFDYVQSNDDKRVFHSNYFTLRNQLAFFVEQKNKISLKPILMRLSGIIESRSKSENLSQY